MATVVLLVRHGESEWNALGRWQGWADIGLSDLGRRQADLAAPAVGEVDGIVASDLSRARETATRIAAAIGGGLEVVTDEGLRERDAGELTGLTRPEIAERFPHLGIGGAGFEPPGGETTEHLLARVHAALARIEGRWPSGRVLAVSHAGVVRALEGWRARPPGRLPNLGGVELALEGGDVAVGDQVLLVDPDDVVVTAPAQD